MSKPIVPSDVLPIAASSGLSPAEYTQIVTTWNQTAADYPPQPIVQCFAAQVERTPDAIAALFECQFERQLECQFEADQITYQALNARANQLAHRLRQCGVGPNVLVGLCVERGLDLLVGLLGILKAGGAYVPIDPDYPPDRIALMLEDSQAPVLVSQGAIVDRLNVGAATVIRLDWDAAILAAMPVTNPVAHPAVPGSLDDLAYILYTSGSTGRPKGVMISQRAFANHLWSMVRAPGIAVTDTVLALTSISFDIAGLELLLALIVGAKVVIAPRSLATDGKALGALLDRHAVTLMQATPAGWRLLIESGWQGRPQLKIITGGEPLLRSLADELLTRVDQLWDLYGPTETTVYSTGGPIVADGELVTIGRPVANTQTYILDAQMQPLPIGAIGELYIGGDGVALGYLNRPDLTQERFVPDRFRPETPAKLYRTGDLARYLSDGRIEYLGRIDHQVKIRGYRIELGEIESNLEQHPTVRQAVVMPREDNPDDGPRLVAYVLGRTSNNAPQPAELRSHLRQILPDYMLPAAFVVLEKFPLTPSGKVDRKALPKPAMGRREPATGNAVSASVTALEAQLLPLWEAILGVPVNVDDNFFELGGHSLLAVRLCDRMAQTLGRSLSPTVLFRSPTVAQFALALGASASLDVSSSAVVIQPGTGDGPPLFAIHVLGEGGRFFRPLAQQLGAAQTVYGLAAQMMDKENAPPNRVEDLAAFYIREMRQIQPTGPYYLVGISYGGMVAYEMARQMQQQGLPIGMIGLLDSYGPHPMLGLPSHDRLKAHWRSAREQGLSSYLKHKLGRMLGQRSTQLHCAYGRLVRRLGGQISYEMQYKLVVAENIQASAAYVPGRFEGRLVLFRATAAVFYSQDYLESGLGWRNLVAELAVYDVPGTHMTMVEAPQVRALAAVLGRVAFAVGNPMPTTDGQFPCLVGGAIL